MAHQRGEREQRCTNEPACVFWRGEVQKRRSYRSDNHGIVEPFLSREGVILVYRSSGEES